MRRRLSWQPNVNVSWLTVVLCGALLVTAAPGDTPAFASGARQLHLKGDLNALTERETSQQLRQNAGQQLLVVRIDLTSATLGGAVRLADQIETLPVRTVAWVTGPARDGAGLIALACDEIVLSETASLGAFYGLSRSQAGGDAEDPLRDNFLRLAGKHGLEAGDALPMLEPSLGGGRLDAEAAVEAGVARAIATSQTQLRELLGAKQAIEGVAGSDWTTVVSWLGGPLVRGFLLVLILLGAYLEFQQPGLRVPGAVAAIALVLFLVIPYLSGAASALEMLLLVAGVLLIAVEILLLPGYGVAGIAGLVLIACALVGTFVPPGPDPGWWPQRVATWDAVQRGMIVLMSSVVVGVAGIFLLAKYLPYSGLGRGLMPTGGGGAPLGVDPIPTRAGVGAVGVVTNELSPAGQAQFGDQIVEVSSQGDFVESGTRVEVIQRNGVQVLVRPVE